MSEPTQIYPDLDTVPTGRHRWRMIKDAVARHLVLDGGISVIIDILLIFFYLFIKIAEHLEFENAQKLLSNLPDEIVQNMMREKWDTFVAKYRREQEKQHQYTLFEKQHPAFTQATE